MSRRPRTNKDSRRKEGIREPYARMMFVCEGEKTEPQYLREMCRHFGVSTANFVIYGKECGSSPKTIVQFALDSLKRDKDFELVFCVFDRDTHPDFEEALRRCADLSKSGGSRAKFLAITSSPCFEFWLLLHFLDTDAPIVARGNKSAGDLAESMVDDQMSQAGLGKYEKGRNGVFLALLDRLPLAMKRASRINRARGRENPHTYISDLVDFVESLRKSE